MVHTDIVSTSIACRHTKLAWVHVLIHRIDISRKGDDLQNLPITLLSEEQFASVNRGRRSADIFSDSYLLHRRRRQADENESTDNKTGEP